MNSVNPHWIVVDIEPSIALARAECLQKYHAQPMEKPRAFDVIKDARVARATYQRDLMRQFVGFLVSWLRSTPSPRHDQVNYPADLQPSATAYPRGA